MVVNLWGKIKSRRLSPLYLLYGTESFLLTETYELLIRTVLTEEEREFNVSVYDCEETPVQAALEDAETFPFLGEKRVIIVKNPYFFTAEKEKEITHDLKKLESYITSPSPFSIVVFVGAYEKLDERKKITKLMKEHAEVFIANPLAEKELREWMMERVRQNGAMMEENAVDALLQTAGTNLMTLANELDKLALFVGPGGMIRQETVENLVSRTLEQNVFVLVEKVTKRQIAEALQVFYDLLENNEEPLKILALLANQFRLLYQVKWLAAKGYGQQQIASILKVHPFRIKLAMGQAALFSEEELMKAIQQIAEADYEMKSGAMDRQLIMELLLMKWSNKAK
ncbi:DNA polymerase III subunit delta [Parageobacillus thermoglucosidasius]|uniref:DNA polymerase III subunit delta n=1 Tax=Parageobacillus thermoglucosidasius TaxID=1426 RepID=A0AAN1D7Z1_PARTM|nr:DNA polymerase III subunit delta [Parageobacillus thermoglucosidasius]KYD13814.1 DNA polymerase III delta subunit [Anoxybacillus flavithermus]AEH47158.1 DNA polymerase III, delta subunit [Parageobacillus thermoglucosidasius C56-YS93]ALF11582.1 DNA polymerase III subunit delta [Parageobacillus thermoglucosidasius]ANZ31663.1 DNA polymerase III subunit delta [Parageobacillus thermoglucosidasius]APM82400.1 DNA polymerase III subunit delta [Parageobacillus thermoglucosidasius]